MRIAIPLGIAILSGYFCYNNQLFTSLLGPAITVPFTVSKAFLDGWALDISNRKVKNSSHHVHCKYALSKIPHVRAILTGNTYSITAQTASINDLEVILTDAWKSCSGIDKEQFQKFKGIVGGYKTVLYNSAVDNSITPNISLFISDLQTLETYLRERT